MWKFTNNKRRTISSVFNLVVFVFLVATLSFLLWQLPNGALPTVQMQTKGQVAPISTEVIIDAPIVPVIETGQVVSKTGSVTYILVAAPELGLVIDEKQSIILIEPGSAAERAGLQLGDILESIEDIPLIAEDDRIKAKLVMSSNMDGTVMHLTIIRNGETLELPFIPASPQIQSTDAQSPEKDVAQEPRPTITPVLMPYYFF